MRLYVTFTAFFILLSGFFLSTSCEKEVYLAPSPPDIVPEKSFSAILAGNVFADTVLWAEDDGSKLTITAFENGENGYPRIILKLPSDLEVGSYRLSGPSSDIQGLVEFGPSTDEKFQSIDSTSYIAITTHFTESNLMRAKFSFTAEPSSGNPSIPNIELWEGSLLITY